VGVVGDMAVGGSLGGVLGCDGHGRRVGAKQEGEGGGRDDGEVRVIW